MLYPGECNNFFTKWGTYFKERIIVLGKQEYPAVQQIISSTKNSKFFLLYIEWIRIGKNDGFSRISTTILHKLIAYLRVGIGDLCALYVLVYMLHRSSNRKKGKTGIAVTREGAIAYLLQNVPVRLYL